MGRDVLGSWLWNSLPMPLRFCPSIAVFKRHVKKIPADIVRFEILKLILIY